MPPIPRDPSLDSTLAFLTEGYTFVSSRCDRLGADVFETRLMLRRSYCARGEEAAREFYEPDRFTRRGALPPTTLLLLQDKGSVQLLDGGAHRWRKAMFMSIMSSESTARLADAVAERWRARIPEWAKRDAVVLHAAAQEVLCDAVCRWAGVPLPESELATRTREFAAMIDGAGAVGPRNWRGQLLRARSERWAEGVMEAVRARTLDVPEGSAAHAVAWHRDPEGKLLEPEVARVEFLNVLRPTVAVARFMTFAALALHEHPEVRERLRDADDAFVDHFVQEVRRYYPFFPLVGGRARHAFEWRGHRFPEGSWMLLDLYGTNHDPRLWDEPQAFRPDRFLGWNGSAFGFIPQGGGDHRANHRCPGEDATIAILKRAVRLLATEMRYDVPPQNLAVSLSRMPAIPASGLVIRNVRPPA